MINATLQIFAVSRYLGTRSWTRTQSLLFNVNRVTRKRSFFTKVLIVNKNKQSNATRNEDEIRIEM